MDHPDVAVSALLSRPDARPVLEAWLADHGTLTDAAAAAPGVRALRGRGRVHVVPAPPGPWPADTRWAVRHYQRGGALERLLGDRYLWSPSTRPVREYRAITAVDALGIPTPAAVGAATYPAGLFYRGDLVTEWVPDSRDLAAVLFGAAQLDGARAPGGPGGEATDVAREAAAVAGEEEGAAAMKAAGTLLRCLHDRGVEHPDLNLKNILIAPGAAPADPRGGGAAGRRAWIIDLDRARIRGRVSPAGRRRMLARFDRSLRKWEGRMEVRAPAAWRSAFDDGYQRGYQRTDHS